jgi:hypothetical protein
MPARPKYTSKEDCLASLTHHDGGCITGKTRMVNRRYYTSIEAPESLKTFPETGEYHLHRVMWRWAYPDDPLTGWILSRKDCCALTYCVNPEHYWKSYYNGTSRAGPREKLAPGRPSESNT